MVNSSNYGLGSSVFSANQARALALGNRIRAGMTTVNDFGVNYLVQALPFGGVKFSGFDRFAGPEGLRACCLTKSVVVDKFSSFCRTSIPAPLQVMRLVLSPSKRERETDDSWHAGMGLGVTRGPRRRLDRTPLIDHPFPRNKSIDSTPSRRRPSPSARASSGSSTTPPSWARPSPSCASCATRRGKHTHFWSDGCRTRRGVPGGFGAVLNRVN